MRAYGGWGHGFKRGEARTRDEKFDRIFQHKEPRTDVISTARGEVAGQPLVAPCSLL